MYNETYEWKQTLDEYLHALWYMLEAYLKHDMTAEEFSDFCQVSVEAEQRGNVEKQIMLVTKYHITRETFVKYHARMSGDYKFDVHALHQPTVYVDACAEMKLYRAWCKERWSSVPVIFFTAQHRNKHKKVEQ